VSLDLRVVHPSIDPSVVSKQLGLVLDRGWRAGEPKTTPAGRALRGKRKSSYCSFTLEDSSPRGAAELITRWNDRLGKHARFLRRLVRTGGTAEYYVTWYANKQRGSTGDVLDRSLLLATASIGLGLSVEVLYP
jgi:hypothetical protein